MKHSKPSIAFYDFQLNPDEPDRGGTGIEFTSMANFLKAQKHKVDVHFIPCPPATTAAVTRWQKFLVFAVNQWRDLGRLLTPTEDTLLFVYPKIPFMGHSADVRVLLLALIGYGLMAIKNLLTRQQVVVLITDLPLEQRLMLESVVSEIQLKQKLIEFHNWSQFSLSDQLQMQLERLLFKQAKLIVSLSRLMTDHIREKHKLPKKQICLRGRNAFIPSYSRMLSPISLPECKGVRVFYSGDLTRTNTRINLTKIIQLFGEFPDSHFYLCGQDGAWVETEVQQRGLTNVHYLGSLDFAAHDTVARQCDIGLLLYTFAYAHLVMTSKYSAYVANGLAILSTNLITLAEIIKQDCVGIAIPVNDFPLQLGQWLMHPEQIAPYKKQAERVKTLYSQGLFMQTWFASAQFND